MRRIVFGTPTVVLTALLLAHPSSGSAAAAPHPQPGTRYDIEQRIATEGTYSASGETPVAFSQKVELDLTATALDSQSSQASIEFVYRRVRIDVRMATDSVILELYPNRFILDGTPLYDSETHSDEAPPVLVHLLNETFRMDIGEKGNLVRFARRGSHRRKVAFLDLAEPVRSLWIEVPPGGSKLGDTWNRSEPLRMLGDLLLVPASAEYTVRSAPTESDSLLELTRRAAAINEQSLSLPTRIGYAVPGSLRSDALGPDFFALPPSARFERIVLDSTETIRYRADWGFLQSLAGSATLAIDCSLPRIQGPRRYDRRYDLRRNWTIEVRPADPVPEEADARYLLLGRKEE